MSGRHRRPPAWRRLLMRLRRSDRAARLAALQAEVVALRATVASLRTQLTTAQAEAAAALNAMSEATAAVAAATSPPRDLRWLTIDLPVVTLPTIPSVEVLAGGRAIEIDLRDVIARADLVLSALPEAELLDPKRDRDDEVVDPAVAVGAVIEAPLEAPRRIA